MIWEVERGRSCDSLRLAQAKLIQSQGLELVSTGKELKLAKAANVALDTLLVTAKKSNEVLGMQCDLNLNTEKKKTKKWKKITLTVIMVWLAKEGLNALN